jgi:hypothetical protein
MADGKAGRCACGGTPALEHQHGIVEAGINGTPTVFSCTARCPKCGATGRAVSASPPGAARAAVAALGRTTRGGVA